MSTETAPSRRSYTDEDRARGLAALEAVGGRSKIASIATGYPSSTLERWASSAHVRSVQAVNPQLRAKSEQDLERGLLNVVTRGLKHLNHDELWAKGNVQQVAIAMGIANTHLRLVRSQPTSITASTDLASFLSSAYGKRTIDVPGVVHPVSSPGATRTTQEE